MFDGKAFGSEIVGIVKDYVAREIEPIRRENADLIARLAALESRPIAKDGAAGRDGVDGAAGAGVASAVISDDGVLILRLTSGSEIEAGVVRGADGKEGAEGPAGKDGQDGKDADPDSLAAVVACEVEKAVNGLPKAKDGRDGVDGKDGSDGRDGKDGIGLAGAIIGRDGDLVVTLTNGEAKSLGPIVGRDGANGSDGKDGLAGKNGRDGFSLKDFDAEVMPDGRTLLLKFADETDVGFSVELSLPTMIYRGVFKDGQPYERGDTVTWGGSLWHCDAETNEKPGDGSKSWTLAAKRGRDGKDGKDGERGLQGKDGPRGRDLTQMGPDGAKW